MISRFLNDGLRISNYNAETPLEKHTRGAAFFLLQTLLSFVTSALKWDVWWEKNGSEEVAVFYAKKAVEETKETEKALKVLGLAIE